MEIEIHRQGMRNGKFFDEDLDINIDLNETRRDNRREPPRRQRSHSASTRRRSPSPPQQQQQRVSSRRYAADDEIGSEADFYNRKVRERGYMGEAYNGATKDWGLVDIPPGTERVRMDGAGGGRQEITWERYNGERRGKFYTDDRVYEGEFGASTRGSPAQQPPPPAPSAPAREEIDIDINIREERRGPRPRPAKEPERTREEIRITEKRVEKETRRGGGGAAKDKMWTEVTKDLGAARDADGQVTFYGASDVALHDVDSAWSSNKA